MADDCKLQQACCDIKMSASSLGTVLYLKLKPKAEDVFGFCWEQMITTIRHAMLSNQGTRHKMYLNHQFNILHVVDATDLLQIVTFVISP